LTALYIYVSGSCNLPCRHCWITPQFSPNGLNGTFVKLEHVEKAIREAKTVGLSQVKLTGGEPTLHPRFRELVSLVAGLGVPFWMETNGTLIDRSLAEFLRDTGKAGTISVSLDGAKAETHEALRMVPGSFDRAVAGIKALVDASFRPQVICSLHQGNVSEAAEVVRLAEKLGCGSVKFNIIQEMGRGERFSREEGLSVPRALEFLRHLEKDVVPYTGISIHPDFPMAFWSIRRLLREPNAHCAVLHILGVLATGELSICGVGSSLPELVYGHLDVDDLGEVWRSSPGLQRLRRQIPHELEGVCGECLHRDICLGSCVASNYSLGGKLSVAFGFCDVASGLGLFPESRRTPASLRAEGGDGGQ